MSTLSNIVNAFPISSEEYAELDKKFGNLAHYACWQLKKKNTNNNLSNDLEDDVQELRISLIRAGSYFKRQTYIEACFETLMQHTKDKFIRVLVVELKRLWDDRRHHGANRQRFGEFQEMILDRLVQRHVPADQRPSRLAKLVFDGRFFVYAKHILWNAQRSLGKQITREKSWRTGLVSLSDFDYLCPDQ